MVRVRVTQCSVSGCTKTDKKIVHGLCPMHLRRLQKHGDVNYSPIDWHGKTYTPEWNTWRGIIKRCYQPSQQTYKHYGARGITVCDRWRGQFGFRNFLKDMGERPSVAHSIDRIDNDKGYYPQNCRWATKSEQSRNRKVCGDYPNIMLRNGWYQVLVQSNGKRIYSRYPTLNQALEARDRAYKECRL